jgi:uncharacterized membrane protein
MILLVSGFGFAISIYIFIEAILTLITAARSGANAARYRFAGVVLAAMSFLVAASLIKSMLVVDWTSIGTFAAIFVMRTFLKFVLTLERQALHR